MNWTIRKNPTGGFVIVDRFQVERGTITFHSENRYAVKLHTLPAFDFTGSHDQCVGYVRGVERAVGIYVKESV